MSVYLFYVTFPDEPSALDLAGALVKERFAACFNAFPIRNMFWWQGNLESGNEWVAILKTSPDKKSRLQQELEMRHPYEVPCILSWEVEANSSYAQWIHHEVEGT